MGSDSKESACNVGDLGSIPGLGRSPGEGNGYPIQYFCLENSKERGAWWAPWDCKEVGMSEATNILLNPLRGVFETYLCFYEPC